MSGVPVEALRERLVRTTAPCGDLDTYARAVFTVADAAVPHAFACLATADPTSELITWAVKSHPLPMGDEDFAAAEYGGPDVNRFAELARRAVPVGVLSVDTGGQVQRCRRLHDFMTPVFGFTDEIRLVCQARGTTWAMLALYRGAGEPPFTAQDGDRVAELGPTIADGVRRVLFGGGTVGPAGPNGAAVLIVDAADRVTDRTAAVEAYIDELGGWDNDSLPANMLAIVVSTRASGEPATTRVLGRGGRWLALRAMRLAGGSSVVTVDAATPAAISDLTLVARGLTVREQELTRLVLRGASTRAIAESLFLSPHTVQDHLKSIFAKLRVGSRRELVAQLVLAETATTGARP